MDEIGDQIEAAGELGSAEGHEAKSKTSGGSSAGNVAMINAEVTFRDVGEVLQASLEELEVRHAFL